MTPLEIKQELKLHGTTQRAIAEQLGVAQMCVSRVIHKGQISDRIMRAVAEAIGRDRTEVFPEYYFGPKRRSTSKVVESGNLPLNSVPTSG